MTSFIGASLPFPVGQVLGAEQGQRFNITRMLRGGPDGGQYHGEDRNGRPGSYILVTTAPELPGGGEEIARGLALRARRVAPLRGIFPLSDPRGVRYHALVEVRPQGAPLAERSAPLAAPEAIGLGVALAETVEAAARDGEALARLRPELTFVLEEGGQLVLTAVVPRADRFLSHAGVGEAVVFEHRYAAPEIDLAGPGTAAAAVFSACAVLAHAASGEHPFEGAGASAQRSAMSADRRRPWTGPPALQAILDRALSADPAIRPSPAELVEELRAVGSAGKSGSRLFGLIPRRRREADAPAERPDGGSTFPLGARLGGGEYVIAERIAGERWRGRYRGTDRSGAPVLVTVTGEQRASSSELRHQLAIEVPGIARLRYVGQVAADRDGVFDGLVEDEPPGTPVAQVRLPAVPRVALELAVRVGEIVEAAHVAGLVVGGLHAELIYLTVEAGRFAVSGIVPRAERFALGAATPSFALPDLFASPAHGPEVLGGGAPSAADDVFALSLLAADWLAGRFPCGGDRYITRAVAVQTGARPELAVPPAAASLLERGLAARPDERPAIGDWLAEARRLLAGDLGS